jgi:hypothetical protein
MSKKETRLKKLREDLLEAKEEYRKDREAYSELRGWPGREGAMDMAQNAKRDSEKKVRELEKEISELEKK